MRALSDIWQEPGHHLTIERPEGEIDFLGVALRTDPGVKPWRFHDREIPLETPSEIMAKKMCFRGNRLLARDLFDIAAIRRLAPRDFDAAILAEPTAARRVADTLQRRSEKLMAELPQAVRPTTSGGRLFDIDIPALVLALNR